MKDVFFQDPWWLILIKVVLLFAVLLLWAIINVWYERRLVGKMQHRLGPIMNGPFGLAQTVAEAVKLLGKEDFRPTKADPIIFNLAPLLTGIAAFTTWSVIPFGGEVEMFGVKTRLQVADLPISMLFILAIAAIGIYGVVLAGWASNSTYSLLGSLRSSAQMISYEVAMGLAIVGVFMMSGSMSTNSIVESQAAPFIGGGLQSWYWLILAPSFIIYVIAMVGETNRAPFDLPECESELVSGYITEYSGFRYGSFFLAEYINMSTVSAVATTLFVGGYLTPWPLNQIALFNNPWFGPLWFAIKVQVFFTLFIWLRGAIPRFRYDQFMALGWKRLIPISLYWIMGIGIVQTVRTQGIILPQWVFVVGALLVVALLVYAFWPESDREDPGGGGSGRYRTETFDAFAGGYPVPPPLGQQLPELAGVVVASVPETDEETTDGTA